MKVVVALLADHAVAQNDGKVYVLGGGLDSHISATYPAKISVAVVLKIAFSPSECGREHRFELRILSPGGEQLRPSLVLPLLPVLRPEAPGNEVSFPFVQNVKDLDLVEPGTYSFVLRLEDAEDELAHVDLNALRGPSLRSSAANALNASLNAGFEAFDAGHIDAALTIFTTAATDFPNSPDVHNNLGFTLMTALRPEEALSAFEEARRLGYPQLELLQANRACCLYLSGAYEDSLEQFQMLMKMRLTSSVAILCALTEDAVLPVWLTSAGDLVALAALNASWSAVRAGHLARAHEFAQMATAGRLTFGDHNGSREVFGTALQSAFDAASGGVRND